MLNNTNTQNGQRKTLRCAIYTRKSHEEGLEQEFNSLDAQREAGEAYIESQKLQGWKPIPYRYDDGGFSGGTMERPALRRLLADIDDGKIDVIVVYKIDRLSRSLLDFMKMIEVFNEKEVSFVSVTQHFSTTDPTGRMFLGILITFAQYEREVIGERIRDKVAAAKRRGKYCGGPAVLGYDVDRENKKLLINQSEAPLIKLIFRRYVQVGSAKKVAQVYRLLNNRLYLGEIAYKGNNYPAEHEALIDQNTWDKVQALLSENNRTKMSKARVKMVSPLSGVIRCGHCDSAMGITYTNKGDRRYSYYICEKDTKRAVSRCPLKRVPAGDIESVVLDQLGAVFRTPTLVAKTYFAAREIEAEEQHRLQGQKKEIEQSLKGVRQEALKLMSPDNDDPDRNSRLPLVNQQAVDLTKQLTNVSARLRVIDTEQISEGDVSEAFQSVETFWEDLFPLERNRLIQLLVETIEIRETGIDMELKTNGLTNLVTELAGLACEVKERSNS
jgi:site-specific DNA recombinase